MHAERVDVAVPELNGSYVEQDVPITPANIEVVTILRDTEPTLICRVGADIKVGRTSLSRSSRLSHDVAPTS